MKIIFLFLIYGLFFLEPTGFAFSENFDEFHKLLYHVAQGKKLPKPAFHLKNSGCSKIVNYENFGEFKNKGTDSYLFHVNKPEELKNYTGYFIYPDETDVYKFYEEFVDKDVLKKNHWDALRIKDLKKAYITWSAAYEDPGVKTYFQGALLEKAGLIIPALKAYYAVIVHFPNTPCWNKDKSYVWYVSRNALYNIKRILRDYSDPGMKFTGCEIIIENGADTDTSNDVVKTTPGKFVKHSLDDRIQPIKSFKEIKVKNIRGKGKVKLLQFENDHWQMEINGEPFFIRGVSYSPTLIGTGPDTSSNFFNKWMFQDTNNNGIIDAPYEAFVDKNINGNKDKDELPIGDFQLMKNMGVNAIRMVYTGEAENDRKYDPALINKPLLRELYEKYGIWVIMNNFLGAYTIGSGATWEKGTDYNDDEQKKKMKEIVRDMVLDLKDEPFILMWVLGNENNLPQDYMGLNATRTNAASYPEAYAKYINEVADMIHEIDKNHPVAVGNWEEGLIDYYAKYSPSIDIIGINSYQGTNGFGGLWENVKSTFDRPILITEYGCDAYSQGEGENLNAQRKYFENCHRDIVFNMAGGEFTGNSIGGIIFQYVDEWWKDTHSEDSYYNHQTNSTMTFAAPDGYSHEEWFGIVGQGSGENSPFERRLRDAYYYFESVSVDN